MSLMKPFIISNAKKISDKYIFKIRKPKNILKVPEASTNVNLFKCKFPGCRRTFEKSCGLGGHTSKAHPLFSEAYKKK